MMTEYVHLILLGSGVATMGAGVQFFAPRLVLKLLYDADTFEPNTLLLARHGGLLIFLVGALLVYSAYDPSMRDPVLVVASLEKIVLPVSFSSVPLTRPPSAYSWRLGTRPLWCCMFCTFWDSSL